MALNIDVKTRVKAAAFQTVPLIVLSSLFLVFFEIKEWSPANVGLQVLRAVSISASASIIALSALWIGLSIAQARQSKALGWLAGGAFSILVILLVFWFFPDAETSAN
jgi:hypothetical protein